MCQVDLMIVVCLFHLNGRTFFCWGFYFLCQASLRGSNPILVSQEDPLDTPGGWVSFLLAEEDPTPCNSSGFGCILWGHCCHHSWCFHLLKNIVDFPLSVLKGIYHYWKCVYFVPGGAKANGRVGLQTVPGITAQLVGAIPSPIGLGSQ